VYAAGRHPSFDDQQRQPRLAQRPVEEDIMPGTQDRVVTSVATQLMKATARTADRVSERVLAQLAEQFDVDAGFLRHNDHYIQAGFEVGRDLGQFSAHRRLD
jgi:hypothetical protein